MGLWPWKHAEGLVEAHLRGKGTLRCVLRDYALPRNCYNTHCGTQMSEYIESWAFRNEPGFPTATSARKGARARARARARGGGGGVGGGIQNLISKFAHRLSQRPPIEGLCPPRLTRTWRKLCGNCTEPVCQSQGLCLSFWVRALRHVTSAL